MKSFQTEHTLLELPTIIHLIRRGRIISQIGHIPFSTSPLSIEKDRVYIRTAYGSSRSDDGFDC